jgi:hypothetical protein
VLAHYSPEVADVRAELRRSIQHQPEVMWPDNGSKSPATQSVKPAGHIVDLPGDKSIEPELTISIRGCLGCNRTHLRAVAIDLTGIWIETEVSNIGGPQVVSLICHLNYVAGR